MRTQPRLLASVALVTVATLLAPTSPASAATPSYVALGDSYSSGVGTRSYLSDGTSCQRSTYAYPSLVAAARGYALNFRACSGAKISDVTNTQLGALAASTGYVTISVGGNDAGFADVLTECAQPGWMSNCNGAIDKAQAYINNTLPGRLATLYASIRTKRPEREGGRRGLPADLQRRGLQRRHLVLPGRGDAAQRHRRPAELARPSAAAAAKGFSFANPTSRFVGPRGLRQPRVAQRAVQPDQRELPPEPDRPRVRLHARWSARS